MARNPVMFVVEVGSVLTTSCSSGTRDRRRRRERVHRARRRSGCGSPCCSPTSPRRWPRAGQGAGRHAAQDPRRRRSRGVRRPDGTVEEVPRAQLAGRRRVRRRRPARSIPGDGEVIEGIASVDESAITGESAPVIRESGGDRSAVTGGTRVLSDRIVVRDHAEAGRDVPRPDDRARRGRRAAEDAERDRPQHPAGRADDHLPARRRHAAAVRHLLGRASSRSSCWSRCWSA